MNKKRKLVLDDDLDISQKRDESLPVDETMSALGSRDKQDFTNKIMEGEEDEESQKKKLDEVEQTVSKHNSKKKKILNWVFFAINIVVVVGILIYQLSTEHVASPAGLTIYAWPLLSLLAVFVILNLSEAFGTSYLVKRNTGRWQFGLSYKTNAIGRYYDAVTPLATGGQPFQIAYLKSHNVPLHSAMSIPLAKMVFHQLCWLVISLVCLITSFVNPKYNTFVSITSIIGFVLGSAVLFLILFLSVSRSFGKKLVVAVLKFLQKIKILKNYEKQYEKIMKTIEDYQSVMRQYTKSPRDFIVITLSFFVKLVAQYSLPYFVFCVFSGFESGLYLDFFVMSVLIDLAASFFPLPGGTGMSELTFTAMFAAAFSGSGLMFWALLTWRFLTYYFFLVQGIGIISYDMFYGNRKYKWQIRRETLLEESNFFRQEQINKFRAERNKQRRAAKRKSAK